VYPRRQAAIFLIHPVTAGLAIDDTHPFADRIEDQIGLLRYERAL